MYAPEIKMSDPLPTTEAISLRQADWSDVNRVWSWSNDEDARAASIHTAAIAVADHVAWYSAKLCTSGHYMWIIVAGGHDCGVVRIDASKSEVATVSIALAKDARGAGIGSRALRAACERFDLLRADASLEAWIASDNVASSRCFTGCGFELAKSEDIDGRLFNVYRKDHREH